MIPEDFKLNRSTLIVFGAVALVACATGFLFSQLTKKQSDVTVTQPQPAAVSTIPVEDKPQAEQTTDSADNFVPVAVKAPAPGPTQSRANSKLRRSGRNKLASLLPGPPSDIKRHAGKTVPTGVVEMWSGDKEAFVAVPKE